MKKKLAQKVISFVCAVSVMMQIAAPAFAAGTDIPVTPSETTVETQVVEEEPKVDEESIVVEEQKGEEPAAPEAEVEAPAAPEAEADQPAAGEVAEPEVKAEAVEMNLVAGDQNGNGHFGNSTPEAFVLSADSYNAENFSFTFKLNSAKNASRFRFVTKYVSDTEWGYIAYDGTNDHWFYEYKNGNGGYPDLTGLPAVNTGDVVNVSGEYTSEGLKITVTNTTTNQTGEAVANNADFLGLKDKAGKVGFGAAKYQSEFTDVIVSNLVVGEKTYAKADYEGMTKYKNMSFTWAAKEETAPAAPVTVTGKVVNEAGEPVANANVALGEKTATTDAEGNFTLTEVAANQEHNLTITADGYNAKTQKITVEAADLTLTENIVLVKEAAVDPDSKLWYVLKSNGTGGHNYGGTPGPATALYHGAPSAKEENNLSLEFKQVSGGRNFGIFYYYLDANHWMYVGCDSSSGWYCQYKGDGLDAYFSLDKKLPLPTDGQTTKIEISLAREVLSVTVDGVKTNTNRQELDTLSKQVSKNPDTKFGVMTKGNSTVEFANVKVNEKETEDNWQILVAQNGELTKRLATLVTVTGKVVDKDDQPMEDAVVRVADRKVKTGKDGTYTIEKMETGHYTLAVSKPGYQAVSYEFEITDQPVEVPVQKLLLKEVIDFDAKYAKIESETMKVYVGKEFPQVAKYVLKDGSGEMLGQVEEDLKNVAINGQPIAATTSPVVINGNTATYTLGVKNNLGIDLTLTIEISVEGNSLTYRVAKLEKGEGCTLPVKIIDVPGLNLITVTDLDAVEATEVNKPHVGFAGATKSTSTTKNGDVYIGFEDGQGFRAGEKDQYLYGFVTNGKVSAGLFSNSEAEGDRRVLRNNGADCISLTSAPWYYERGDMAAQKYNPSDVNTLTFPTSELPVAKVSLASDRNEDGVIDWNDGAIAFRDIYNIPQGTEVIKDTVNYRIIMNFASMAPNPFLETADNVRKVFLATDGLPQALLLKGYGNEGHDSANSEYADIAEREGGVEDFRELIKIAHKYNTEVGVHVNAQEAYPESNSFSDRMLAPSGWGTHGWGWLDQSHVIDKMWDLTSGNRWARMVQFYDRINGTNHNTAQWPEVASKGTVDSMDQISDEAMSLKDNMDFVYLDVWYQDAWETRRIAEQFNSLGWRFSTEFSDQGEYDSTWQHWATDATYGGAGMKGFNSEIIRFIRNDQRDSQVLNYPPFGGAADNPLLGGYRVPGFEGWQGEQSYNSYIQRTFSDNLPTRFLQHYQVTKWVDYTGAEGDKSPVANQEKQITLKDKDGNTVVVTRNEKQRKDEVIERKITLNGKLVLNDGTYLLPWQDYQGAQDKLYHWNYDGGKTTWELPVEFADAQTLYCYELTDQGRIDPQVVTVTNGSVTLTAKEKTPYVLVREAEVKTLVDNFGDGDHAADPGFNGYADGAKLNAKNWTGTIDNESVQVKKAVTGDQNLVLGATKTPVSISTQITGLTAGKDYVAEIYVDNKSDSKATISVDNGEKVVSNYTYRSIASNYVQCDEGHRSNNYDSKLQWIQVPFVAAGNTATFTLAREAGDGEVFWDDIRIVEKKLNNYREDGTFVQDFESVVQGLYPFVLGPAQGVSDPRTHLAQRNGKFTQSGWQDKIIDDVISGDWSLKHHENNYGIIYQTIPQNFRFEADKMYEVTFKYQSGRGNAYAMVVGNGDSYEMPTEYFPSTAGTIGQANSATTKTHTMQVMGAPNGQTWIGLFCNRQAGGNDMGERDFILDDLVIREMSAEEVGVVLRAENKDLYKGETTKLHGINLDKATFEISDADREIISFNQETLTVGAKKAGTATITARYNGKEASVTITVSDSVVIKPSVQCTGINNLQNTADWDKTIDKNHATACDGKWNAVTKENPLLFIYDLGKSMPLTGFRLLNRNGGEQNGIIQSYRYTIGNKANADRTEILDGVTSEWIDVPAEMQKNSTWVECPLPEGSYQFIQIELCGKNNNATLAEFEVVYNKKVADEATLTDLTMKVGETKEMTIAPVGDTVLKGIVWSTEDNDIIKVDQNGNVTALKAGTATVTVSNAAGLKATATVTVTTDEVPVTLERVEVTKNPAKDYVVGDNFDVADVEVTAYYSDGTSKVITEGLTVTNGDNLKEGEQTITISYTVEGVTKETTVTVNVKAATPVDPVDPVDPVKPVDPEKPVNPDSGNNQPALAPARPGNGAATGDTTNMGLWITLLLISGALAAGVYYTSKKKSDKK